MPYTYCGSRAGGYDSREKGQRYAATRVARPKLIKAPKPKLTEV